MQEICSNDAKESPLVQGVAPLSISDKEVVDTLQGFLTKKDIEPEDNFENDVGTSWSDDYDTEFDTDEVVGNNLSSINSYEAQEKMLAGGSITAQKRVSKNSNVSGGIKCLRNFRRKGQANKKKASTKKKKCSGVKREKLESQELEGCAVKQSAK